MRSKTLTLISQQNKLIKEGNSPPVQKIGTDVPTQSRSKTLNLITKYHEILREQGKDPEQPEDPNTTQAPDPSQDIQNNTVPTPEETMPLTSEGEEKYISDLVDAALFEPSAEEANTLLNLQSVMQMKRFTNAREEVLPLVLGIISPSTQGGNLKKTLNTIK